MGDPRKPRKKYKGPNHPWNKSRIEDEKVLIKEYSLKNKKDIWKMDSMIRRFSDLAKYLMASAGPQIEKEKEELLAKLVKLGLLDESHNLNDVLSLDVRDILERRLQTQMYKKGLARSMKQARQFIVHKHVIVKGKVISAPSYILTTDEEMNLGFKLNSSLADPEHIERQIISRSESEKAVPEEEKKETEGKKEKKEKKKEKKGKAETKKAEKSGSDREKKEESKEESREKKEKETKLEKSESKTEESKE